MGPRGPPSRRQLCLLSDSRWCSTSLVGRDLVSPTANSDAVLVDVRRRCDASTPTYSGLHFTLHEVLHAPAEATEHTAGNASRSSWNGKSSSESSPRARCLLHLPPEGNGSFSQPSPPPL